MLNRIFYTRYFIFICLCYKHNTRTLFCSVNFSSLWALINIPTRKNFPAFSQPCVGLVESTISCQLWKQRNWSVRQEVCILHLSLRCIFQWKKILRVGRMCPEEALLTKTISSSPSCTCHPTLHTIFYHLCSLFCGLLSPFCYILLDI